MSSRASAAPIRSRAFRLHRAASTAGIAIATLWGAGPGDAHAQAPAGIALMTRSHHVSDPRPDSSDETSEEPGQAPAPGPMFPGEGRFALSAAGGLPFLAIGEASWGPTDWFAVGLVGGVASDAKESAFGVRPRVLVLGDRDLALVASLPMLFYPPSDKRHGETWLLANPKLLVAGQFEGGVSVYGGVGGMLTSCSDSVGDHFSGEEQASPEHEEEEPMVDGVWNTVHAGASVPLGSQTSVFFDSGLVMSGFEVSESYAEKVGVPVLLQAGMSQVF